MTAGVYLSYTPAPAKHISCRFSLPNSSKKCLISISLFSSGILNSLRKRMVSGISEKSSSIEFTPHCASISEISCCVCGKYLYGIFQIVFCFIYFSVKALYACTSISWLSSSLLVSLTLIIHAAKAS